MHLDELLAENQNLSIVYILKDDLKRLWSFTEPLDALLFWMEWRSRVLESHLAPLIHFAENLNEKIDFVISHCFYPLGTNILEGVNNKIKVIKRMAYGFRDNHYFFLKNRNAFPNIPEEPKKSPRVLFVAPLGRNADEAAVNYPVKRIKV